MQVEVVMPKMGESIQEGKILRWTKKIGDKSQWQDAPPRAACEGHPVRTVLA